MAEYNAAIITSPISTGTRSTRSRTPLSKIEHSETINTIPIPTVSPKSEQLTVITTTGTEDPTINTPKQMSLPIKKRKSTPHAKPPPVEVFKKSKLSIEAHEVEDKEANEVEGKEIALVEVSVSTDINKEPEMYFDGKLNIEDADTQICMPELLDKEMFTQSLEVVNQPESAKLTKKLSVSENNEVEGKEIALVEVSVSTDINKEPEMYFDGKLNIEDADTQICMPELLDKEMFTQSLEVVNQPESAKLTKKLSVSENIDELVKYRTLIMKIPQMQVGSHLIETWYAAPYPQEYNSLSCLYLCDNCFKYMKSDFALDRHKRKCPLAHPPGDEIYRDRAISVFEVDGRKNKVHFLI